MAVTRMTRIKFCGLKTPRDVEVAAELQVDAVGFVFWENSPRAVRLKDARDLIAQLPASVAPVGVFVRPAPAEIAHAVEITGIRIAQVHDLDDLGPLAAAPCELWQALPLARASTFAGGYTLLLDAEDPSQHGGTGRTIDWDAAARLAARHRVILAGGLTAANVGQAILRARPYGVDVSSGIEDRPGVKSETKMRAFAEVVRGADRV